MDGHDAEAQRRMNPLHQLLLALVTAVPLWACTTPAPAPARIQDQVATEPDGSRPRVFAVLAVNGQPVLNTYQHATDLSSAMGITLMPFVETRSLAAGPVRLRVVAASLPSQDSRRTERLAERELAFTAQAGRHYRASGAIDRNGVAMWVEEYLEGPGGNRWSRMETSP
jgi:hypothetical protein